MAILPPLATLMEGESLYIESMCVVCYN